MKMTITALESSPDGGQGLARDMPVRWALEEVGQPYDGRLLSFEAMKKPAHKALHPFGQIPTFEHGNLALFESGAIVLHIAQYHVGLLPHGAEARARAIAWLFAALNTVEPPIVELDMSAWVDGDKPWYQDRLPMLRDRVNARLNDLSIWLGQADWLEDSFTVGDLMLVTVLRRLHGAGLLESFPNMAAYVARGEARPAFKIAFDAQLAVFKARPLPSA
jgi:glutathione S-transferase